MQAAHHHLIVFCPPSPRKTKHRTVVSSCALGTFTSSQAVNHVVGLVCALPLLCSFESLRASFNSSLSKTSDVLMRLSQSSFWWVSSFVQSLMTNFGPALRQWRVALNTGVMVVFASALIGLLVHFIGMAGLGKYYLAPLLVFHLWQSVSVKISSDLYVTAKVSDKDATLTEIARAIMKQYEHKELSLPSVSRLIAKARKSLSTAPAAYKALERIWGWEALAPPELATTSLRTFGPPPPVSTLHKDPAVAQEKTIHLPNGTVLHPTVYKFHLTKTIKVVLMNLAGVIGLYRAFTLDVDYRTWILCGVMYWLFGLGITGGYHRLWSHKSYSAVPALEWALAWFGAGAGEGSIYWWSRDHRLHHKFTDTDIDPYSIELGFWWSHITWLCHTKHPAAIEAGIRLEKAGVMDDLLKNPVVMFQHKWYGLMFLACTFLQPYLIASLWGDAMNGLFIGGGVALLITFQSTMCVNSLAHCWGEKPYNPRLSAVQNTIVAIITYGEGWFWLGAYVC